MDLQHRSRSNHGGPASVRVVAHNNRPYNNALHQTKRGGAPASQAVVEARFAGERECSTDPTECGPLRTNK